MEKVYKAMGQVATCNLVLGIIMIIVGVSSGVITIVGGARLLKNRSGLLF
ncbi:hypothetical protein ACTQ6A_16405 [Lachnospiraceae bacterium LCP25S3_G4]